MHKEVNGNQCTIRWNMDHLIISHVEETFVELIPSALNKWYVKETPLVVTWGKVHDYLGMRLDLSTPKIQYVKDLLTECPDDLMKGTSATANHLFEVNDHGTNMPQSTARRILPHDSCAKP